MAKEAQSKKIEKSRKMTEIVLEHPEFKYHDIHAPTLEESDKKLIQRAKEIFSKIEIVIHGMEKRDKETGEQKLAKRGDIDGEAVLGLLRLADIKPKSIEYIDKGKYIPGKMHIDTGGRNGIVIEKEKDGKITIFFDHHARDFSLEPTSATQLMYEGLTSAGLLKEDSHLDKLVKFVTQVDNLSYPENYYERYPDYDKMLIGLWSHIKFRNLLNFFQEGRTPTDILAPEEITKYDLQQTAERQKEVIAKSLKVLEEMENRGLIIETDKYGKIAVDIGKRLPGGTIAAKYRGCDGYISWRPNDNGFFITVPGQNISEEFNQGIKVRGSMWLKNPNSDPSPRTVTLNEILNKLSGGKLDPTGELKEYLDKERVEVYSKDMVTEIKRSPEFPKSTVVDKLIDRLDLLLAQKVNSKEISSKEYKLAVKVLDRARDLNSTDPRKALNSLLSDDDWELVDDELFKKTIKELEAEQNKTSSTTEAQTVTESETEMETEVETTSPASPEQDNTARLEEIEQHLKEINKDLSEKVLRWSDVQKLKKDRENLWIEKGNLLGHKLRGEEKWNQEQVDRFIKAQEGPETIDPSPAFKPIGIEKAYWEDIKKEMKEKEKTQNQEEKKAEQRMTPEEKNQAEIEKIKQEVRNIRYAINKKSGYLNNEVAKMIAHALATGRVPGIGPEGLAYWENEGKRTEKEVKELEKELKKLKKELPNDALEPELQPEPVISEQAPKPESRLELVPDDVLGQERIRPEEEPAKEARKEFKGWVNRFFTKEKAAQKQKEAPLPETGSTIRDKIDMLRTVRAAQLGNWLKERVKSLFIPVGKKEIPIPTIIGGETVQAEILRRGTKSTAEQTRERSKLLQDEILLYKGPDGRRIGQIIDRDQAEEIAREVTEAEKLSGRMFANEEFSTAIDAAVKRRVEENNKKIETIIAEVATLLVEKLAKARGQATAEKVLTPARIAEIQDELRIRLNDLRKNWVALDTKSFIKVMRDTLDKKYWLRYFYDISKILAIAGIFYRNLGHDTPILDGGNGQDVELSSPTETITLEEKRRWMDEHLWQESKDILNEQGLSNPTNEQIQTVDNQLALENSVKVIDPQTKEVIWPSTAGGEIIDRAMQARPIDATKAVELAKEIASKALNK